MTKSLNHPKQEKPEHKWRCGKCEQDSGLFPTGERIPEHTRHCPKSPKYKVEKQEKPEQDKIVLRVYPERIKRSFLHEKMYYEIIIIREDIEPLMLSDRKRLLHEVLEKIKYPNNGCKWNHLLDEAKICDDCEAIERFKKRLKELTI